MAELTQAQLAIECLPQPIQLGAQIIKDGLDGLVQPGHVAILHHLGLPVQCHQFIAEAAVLNAVLKVEFAGGKTFTKLSIDPEFVSIPANAGWLRRLRVERC